MFLWKRRRRDIACFEPGTFEALTCDVDRYTHMKDTETSRLRRLALLTNPQATTNDLTAAALSGEDYQFQWVAALHPNTSPNTREQLTDDCISATYAAIAANPHLYALDHSHHPAHDYRWQIRATYALHPQLPATHANHLANDTNLVVLVNIAVNPNTPAQTAATIMAYHERIRQELLTHRATPVHLLCTLAKSRRYEPAIATHPNTPAHIIDTIFRRGNPQTMTKMAASWHTPADRLQRVYDTCPDLDNLLAYNGNASASLLHQIATASQRQWVHVNIAGNRHASTQTLHLIAARYQIEETAERNDLQHHWDFDSESWPHNGGAPWGQFARREEQLALMVSRIAGHCNTPAQLRRAIAEYAHRTNNAYLTRECERGRREALHTYTTTLSATEQQHAALLIDNGFPGCVSDLHRVLTALNTHPRPQLTTASAVPGPRAD